MNKNTILFTHTENLPDSARITIFDAHLKKYIPNELREYLIENHFFNQVASTRFHGNYKGGLFDHSYNVMTKLLELTKKLDLFWEDERSPYIIGMLHDICKMDEYKILDDGKIIHINDTEIKGHGEKSCIILSKFINLTPEEILCIRYHMGAFIKDDWNAYGKAIENYENVLWTHTADMYSSRLLV